MRFGRLAVAVEEADDGVMLVRSTERLADMARALPDRLAHWANVAPDRVFLAQRRVGNGDWRRVSYGEMWDRVQRIATALIARRLDPGRPIAILSGNSIEHAQIALAAMTIGVPYAPLSPAYALLSQDFAKLGGIVSLLAPQLVVAIGSAFERALAATAPADAEIITEDGRAIGSRPTTSFDTLLGTSDGSAIGAALASISPETIAKVLFTSGSTGTPKGVITTQRMLMANQAMLLHWLPDHAQQPPVLVDWLPWHHTFGGNHNFGMVLHCGGTLYIDDGRPTPERIGETIRNLGEIAPTIYFNVPKGYEELVAAMRDDAALRATYFSRLGFSFYSGASLPAHVREELLALSLATTGVEIPIITAFGATETAPAALANTLETALPGNIGLPLPGVTMKLVPCHDGKLEARIKGANVTPGYWRDATQTVAAFDEDDFYRLGDALLFAEPRNAARGFVFDGRIAEDFKLATGTWVNVLPLRNALIRALQPFVRDVVIAGHDRNDVTALLIPDLAECRNIAAHAGGDLEMAAVLRDAALQARIGEQLRHVSAANAGTSMRVAGVALLDRTLTIDAGEITDKGSINQRAVLARHADLVDALYQSTPHPLIVRLAVPHG